MMNRIDYYRAMLLGIVIGMVFLSFFYVFTSEDKTETKPKSNFEIVDTYKDCDVVRWGNGMLAEYKYFLNCKNER
jgi:hypothetical protein